MGSDPIARAGIRASGLRGASGGLVGGPEVVSWQDLSPAHSLLSGADSEWGGAVGAVEDRQDIKASPSPLLVDSGMVA